VTVEEMIWIAYKVDGVVIGVQEYGLVRNMDDGLILFGTGCSPWHHRTVVDCISRVETKLRSFGVACILGKILEEGL